MNGPHSVTAPGPCLQNNSVFAARRYHENIGQGAMRGRELLLYSWRPVARDLTSVKVCMLPAYNYPLPVPLCLQTKYNYGNFKQSLTDSLIQTGSGDRGKTVNSRHYQCEEGETEYLSPYSSQCSVYHKRVLGGGGWENMFLFTSRQSGGDLRKAYKQTLGETSRNNFSPLSVLSMQDGRVYNFLNSCSKVKYFRNNLCSLFPHISRQMSKSAEWAPGLTGLSSPRFSEFVSPVERGKN